MTASFENVHEALKVGINVSMRVRQRITNTSLCGEVNDGRKLSLRKELLNGFAVGNIEMVEIEPAAFRQPVQSRLLELRVVIGSEIVDAHHPPAGGEPSVKVNSGAAPRAAARSIRT